MKLTHPDKILYPEAQITKLQVAEYLLSVQKLMFPYIRNRLLTLVRCPNGRKKKCFFQKHFTETNEKSICKFNVKDSYGIQPYLYLKDKFGILYLAQMGVLEIHVWGSHIKNIEKPDVMLFDLDPSPSVEWQKVVQLAHFMKDELEKIKLKSFVKLTGGNGLHILIPITPKYSWAEVKNVAKNFAQYIENLKPDICTASMSSSRRKGKIFIDYLRNVRGATSIAPYSMRAREGAPVAVPISWKELTAKIHSNSYTIKNIAQRLKKLKQDPWTNFYKTRQTIKKNIRLQK